MSGSTIVGQGSVATDLNIESGGTVFVAGTLENSVVGNYSTEFGLSGSEFINDDIGFGGTQILDSAAYAAGTQIIGEYSSQIVSAGATAIGDYINIADPAVYNYGTLINANDVAGYILNYSGGVTDGTQLSQGSRASFPGLETVLSGGEANTTVINSGGQQSERSGGYADDTVINTGGANGDGGIEDNTTINTGGIDYVYGSTGALGTATSTTINLGGIQAINVYGISSLAIVEGLLTASSGGEVSTPVIEGGTVIIDAGATLINGATFVGAGGILDIGGTSGNFAVIGFESGGIGGDVLDLSGTSISSASELITLGSDAVLNIGSIATSFVGDASLVLNVTSTSSGVQITEDAPCFVGGTQITVTENGQEFPVRVEELAIGDTVVTQNGVRKVKWIGKSNYDGRFLANNHLMLPVCLKSDAIAAGVPSRDLYVSPGHAICLDNMLIPAWRLINGVSITQAERVESVSYFHVELEQHDIIFAENCPTESFFNGAEMHRAAFHNAAEFVTLYPDDQDTGAMCLPRVEQGFALEAIRTRIAARAGIVTPARQPGTLRGFVDQAGDEGVVSGWARDAAQLEQPVVLDVLLQGRRAARVIANQYRADVRKAGFGSGCCGFELKLPAGMTGRVEIRQSVDLQPLPLATTPPRRPTVPGDIPSAGMAA